jgi:hypothetical protein
MVSCRLGDYVWDLTYDMPVNVEPRRHAETYPAHRPMIEAAYPL